MRKRHSTDIIEIRGKEKVSERKHETREKAPKTGWREAREKAPKIELRETRERAPKFKRRETREGEKFLNV